MTSLRITEIFLSLQGESNTVGIPTVFIRLTGCPLRCVYCDTEYAFSGGERKEIRDIVNEVASFGVPYVTVTGGEPLAQPACLELMRQLVDLNYIVSLETSGAIDISEVDPRVVKVMDLKTPSSGELSKNRYENIPFLNRCDQVKFVIGNDDDYIWSKNTIAQFQLFDCCEILFSPVMDQQNPKELAEKILRDKLPVRFQIQLHKYLWDDARGK
ncbi:MAG: 7-carboxy-7-deazaguanine synthase QueE [Methylococcaceae bacterium]|nr:7-carboxy-7-deazaguanine synthase QueE [Methylococcaceae bacterium]